MYAELHLHTEYSFLDGASSLRTLAKKAHCLGIQALAMTDHNNVCAAVKFRDQCKNWGVKPILGAEVTMEDESHLTLLAQNRAGYANLCTLLTLAHDHGGRLTPRLPWNALPDLATGLFCLSGCHKSRISSLTRKRRYEKALKVAVKLREWFGAENFYIELQDDFTPGSLRVCREQAKMADDYGFPVVATNNVHYCEPDDFITHDVLRCIEAGITVHDLHPNRPLNDDRHLKDYPEMVKLFDWRPDAIANTMRIADRCENALPESEEITPRYPLENAHGILRERAYRGAKERYGNIDEVVKSRLEHELRIICELGFADYFLMVQDIVHWTRAQGIRCTGRGSAADSCVAYCLHMTDVDVIKRNLPFERFLTRGKSPDIDMDFPSDRRDEVFQHIMDTYGEAHVGRVCTFHSYWARSAIRDIGKVLAIPPDILGFLSKHISTFINADALDEAFDSFPELKPYAALRPRYKTLFDLCAKIAGFPRHLGSHSSGVVISRVPLSTVAPLQPSAGGILPIWTLDKDDSEIAGAVKFDVLALRMLSAVADAEAEIAARDETFDYEKIPDDDRATYQMMQSGKAIGAFQFESAAQLSLAVSLLPDTFEDLVAAVALIRPGPIRGNVVSRFVDATRTGWTRTDTIFPILGDILDKTYGCIVYQEQANHVIARMTGCSDAAADKFRKGLAKHLNVGTLHIARKQFVDRVLRLHGEWNGGKITERRAHMLFDEIEGWSGYGFIEGHAASFALTGYRTAYLSEHRPAEYFAGMMNHQPMGFYSANTLAAEARRRGVQIRPLDINASDDKCVTEDPFTIRLGLRLAAGLTKDDIETILRARAEREFDSLLDFCVRIPMHRDRLENLILGGAFDTLHDHRRGLLFALDETMSIALSYRGQCLAKSGPLSNGSQVLGVGLRPPNPQSWGNQTGFDRVEPEEHLKLYLASEEPTPLTKLDARYSVERGEIGQATQMAIDLGSIRDIPTPVVTSIEDFSEWDRFLWTWRIVGVTAECHVFSHLRDRLTAHGYMTAYEAQRQRPGTVVKVAGLNIRPHRPATRTGNRVLFASLEDETDLIQLTCFGDAIDRCTPVFLVSAAILISGRIERHGTGTSLLVDNARPLSIRDIVVRTEIGRGQSRPVAHVKTPAYTSAGR